MVYLTIGNNGICNQLLLGNAQKSNFFQLINDKTIDSQSESANPTLKSLSI